MNWSDFYLICFLVGFGLSVVALLAGSVHVVASPHLPEGGPPLRFRFEAAAAR